MASNTSPSGEKPTSGRKVLTPPGMLSYPNLWTPKAVVAGQEPRYSTVLIFSPLAIKTPEYKALQIAVADVARARFGDKVDFKKIRLPFRPNSEKEGKEGFVDGGFFINPWSKTRCGVVNLRSELIIDSDEVWPGQMARLSVTPFAYASGSNLGVSFGLNSVQILKAQMPRLDGRTSATEEFGSAAIPDGYGDGATNGGAPADDEIPFFMGFDTRHG